MEWWHAIVLGLVEGITEYLPVSSTGHLILTSALLKLDTPAVKDAVDDFNIVIQGGAILAVLGLYRRRVAQMFRGLAGRDPAGFRLALNLFIAFVPAAFFGWLLHDWIKSRLFFAGPVLGSILVGGLYMIGVDMWRRGRFGPRPHRSAEREIDDLTPLHALVIGALQVVAMWPGTSRSLMTITGGLFVGLRPAAAAEFSFLLGLPTLGAATVYSLAKNLARSHGAGEPNLVQKLGAAPCLLGLACATVSAALAVKWLVAFLNRHGLAVFGWYRIGLFAVLVALTGAGLIKITPD